MSLPARSGRLRTGSRRAVPAPARPRALPRSDVLPSRPERFGSLARRRRRASLALLPILLAVAVLLLSLPRLDGAEPAAGLPFLGDRTNETQPSTPNGEANRQSAGGTASGDVAAARAPKAGEGSGTAAGSTPTSGETVETRPGEIPDVSGRSIVEAAKVLSEAGYDVAAVQAVKSQQEAGTTVRTEPAAGSAAEPGSPVVLVMSGGPSGTETGS